MRWSVLGETPIIAASCFFVRSLSFPFWTAVDIDKSPCTRRGQLKRCQKKYRTIGRRLEEKRAVFRNVPKRSETFLWRDVDYAPLPSVSLLYSTSRMRIVLARLSACGIRPSASIRRNVCDVTLYRSRTSHFGRGWVYSTASDSPLGCQMPAASDLRRSTASSASHAGSWAWRLLKVVQNFAKS